MPVSVSGAAFAVAVADSDSVMALLRAWSSAPAPETKGALKEVPPARCVRAERVGSDNLFARRLWGESFR